MGLIYLDTCLVIYLVENHPGFGGRVAERIAQPDLAFATSGLVKMECLVGPMKANDQALLSRYPLVLSRFHNLSATEAVFEQAARIRADHGLRTPDALHLAIAKAGGCTALWTNDDRFAKAAAGFAVDFRAL
ncbi:MAG: type II toxin-antitoxin system VapC family toxin [Propionibacteriaceae bacterium]|nr:type II toxin-antitoxin system VapC family toxin [Propionibacteriaceae bacterium]